MRAASPGLAVSQLNCHPFVRHRFAFMHNGGVGGFARLRRKLREGLSGPAYDAIEGSTDSEHVLALLSDYWFADDQAQDSLERAAGALRGTIARLEALRAEFKVDAPSYLNLAITDGQMGMVSRYVSPGASPAHSLYVARGALVVKDGEGQVAAPEPGADAAAVLVASEPLGDRARWEVIPENHMVLIDAERQVSVRAI